MREQSMFVIKIEWEEWAIKRNVNILLQEASKVIIRTCLDSVTKSMVLLFSIQPQNNFISSANTSKQRARILLVRVDVKGYTLDGIRTCSSILIIKLKKRISRV